MYRSALLTSVLLGLCACADLAPEERLDGGELSGVEPCGDGACSVEALCASCEEDCASCPWPEDWARLERAVLELVNDARAHGAQCPSGPRAPTHPFIEERTLTQAARLHSLDMGEADYFSHTSQEGSTPFERMRAAGYTAFAVGENIAAGSDTAARVFAGWMSSEGHCRNIMNANANEIGIGYAFTAGSRFGHYWTQNFGQR
jgi:uncharacterized protein YkwD